MKASTILLTLALCVSQAPEDGMGSWPYQAKQTKWTDLTAKYGRAWSRGIYAVPGNDSSAELPSSQTAAIAPVMHRPQVEQVEPVRMESNSNVVIIPADNGNTLPGTMPGNQGRMQMRSVEPPIGQLSSVVQSPQRFGANRFGNSRFNQRTMNMMPAQMVPPAAMSLPQPLTPLHQPVVMPRRVQQNPSTNTSPTQPVTPYARPSQPAVLPVSTRIKPVATLEAPITNEIHQVVYVTPISVEHVRQTVEPALVEEYVPQTRPQLQQTLDEPAALKMPVGKFGHASDYRELRGQLLYRSTGGAGRWSICYAPNGSADAYGGSFTLSCNVDSRNFRPGDYVTVRGMIVDEGAGNGEPGTALYQVEMMEHMR